MKTKYLKKSPFFFVGEKGHSQLRYSLVMEFTIID